MITINPLLRRNVERIKGFVFDCDGVLFDSREANCRYYNFILERMGLEAMDEEQEEYVHAHSVHDSIAKIVPRDRLDEAGAVRAAVSYEHFLGFMRPEAGLYELLGTIRSLGLRQAINTNRTTTMELLLERFDLGEYFFPVVTAGRVSRPKPHPESLHVILDAWKARADEVIFIGDSGVDERTAQAAGVEFWAYKNETLRGACVIPDFWDMRQFLLSNRNENSED